MFIGLMSGTSVDGIDAALVAFKSESSLRVLETEFTAFPDALRDEISYVALNNSHLNRNEDSSLHALLAEHYANASLSLIKKSCVDPTRIQAIANHGQTVRHEPSANPPFSLQLGDGQLIANKTGIKTITQFRQADLAAGGQGAPLMPAFHKAIFDQTDKVFILNLGGIANVTQLDNTVIGFDTGPANCLLDQWIEKHSGHRFDHNGDWAGCGSVLGDVLSKLMNDPYLSKPFPKSTGTDYFNLSWLQTHIVNLADYRPEDIQATLLAFTVQSVALALSQLNAHSGAIYVCGGGAQNTALMTALREELKGYSVNPTDALGVPCDWVESVGFAWLGYCHTHGLKSNLPSVTGARKALVLGEAFTPQIQ